MARNARGRTRLQARANSKLGRAYGQSRRTCTQSERKVSHVAGMKVLYAELPTAQRITVEGSDIGITMQYASVEAESPYPGRFSR